MNKGILLAAALLMQVGCGPAPVPKNEAPVANVPPSPATPSPEPSASPTPIVGVKIDRAETTRFSSGKIPEGWHWVDPDSERPTPHDSKADNFVMKLPSGKDLYGGNRTAPRLLKAVSGDFQLETRVRFDPRGDYQGAGLLIYVDDINYLRLERAFGGLGDGGSGIRFDVRKHDQYTPITTPGEVPTEAAEAELKIVRRENVFTAFWRADESGEWREVEQFVSDFPETVRVGIIGCNTAHEIDVEFSYIRLLPQPVTKPF